MQEKESNIIKFPKQYEDIVDALETNLILEIIDLPNYNKYKNFIIEKFKGKNGTYILSQEVDNQTITISFQI